jgi:hypothetical protein
MNNNITIGKLKLRTSHIISVCILTAALCGLLSYLYISHSKSANIPRQGRSASDKFYLESVSFTEYTDSGSNKKFTINGKGLGLANKRFGIFLIASAKVLRMADAEVVFYTKNTPDSVLRAKRAMFDAPLDGKNDIVKALSRPVEFSGDISVLTEDRRTLTCDRLIWDSAKGRFFANGRCVLTYEGNVVKGDSGQTDVLLKDFNFKTDSKKRLKALGRIF